MTVTPELDVELTDPFEAESPDCELLPVLDELVLLEVLGDVEPAVADDAVAVDLPAAVELPGMV